MDKTGSKNTLAESTVSTVDTAKTESGMFYEEDENKERGNWSGKLDFLLAAIGFAVGLGNIWRFPYLCYKNGGGAFLIPYALCLAFIGLPLFFMELAFGQFASLGPITIWRINPFFKGVGYCMVSISGLVSIYYNIIITYTVFYFFLSINKEVPWKHCNNWWNTPQCVFSTAEAQNSTNATTTTVTNTSMLQNTTSFLNATFNATLKQRTPAQEFWERYVLDQSDGIDDAGPIKWQLALCLLLSWIVIFLCLIKGIKSTGKVVYFTATFPYVMLVVLLIRGLTLPGFERGLKFYLSPKWESLGKAQVWGDAAVQIFYSLGPGWGGLLTMASYNRFHNNCYRDAVIVAIVNCGTSVFGGLVIFSVLGFMSQQLGVPVQNVTTSGPGLAFVVYPEGLARMPGAPFFAVCFFFMLFTLGLDSQFTMLETVISALTDEFSKLRPFKTYVTLGMCIVMFLLGLPQVTRGGIYIMNLVDYYAAGYPLMIATLLELMAIMYIYGYKRFSADIESMIGFKPNIYWHVCWKVLTPLLLCGVIIFTCVGYKPVTYNGQAYPKWAEGVGFLMICFSVIWIPIFWIISYVKEVRSTKDFLWYVTPPWTGQTLRKMTRPTDEWGPALKKHWRITERATQVDMDKEGFPPTYAYDNPALEKDTPENVENTF